MRKAAKAVAVAVLTMAAAIPVGAASSTAKAIGASQLAIETTAYFDVEPFCMDECSEPTAKLSGNGVHQAR